MITTYFKSAAEFRVWLDEHSQEARELWVGFHKKVSGKPSMTWPESVDEALCFGWIDGLRKTVDGDRYMIRFSPRKPSSVWSAVNIKRAQELADQGRMQPQGIKAFHARRENKSGIYSYEQRGDQLVEPYAEKLKKNKRAWAFFQAQPPSYRKAAGWWVVSAKKEETRLKRLETLIEDSAQSRLIKQFIRPKAT
jgi:uncharacterized protein YdeI (YjbR/CyaY-like superfamily)